MQERSPLGNLDTTLVSVVWSQYYISFSLLQFLPLTNGDNNLLFLERGLLKKHARTCHYFSGKAILREPHQRCQQGSITMWQTLWNLVTISYLKFIFRGVCLLSSSLFTLTSTQKFSLALWLQSFCYGAT